MNTLLSHPPMSTTEVSSSNSIVATPKQPATNDLDTSSGQLIFKKFLEDQRFIELLLQRSLLDGNLTRVATSGPAEQAVTPSATILRWILTTLASAIVASTSTVRQFCKAPVLPCAELWEADFVVARVTGRRTSRPEEVAAGDAFSVDDMCHSDRWLRS
jgi:hypothetical protein